MEMDEVGCADVIDYNSETETEDESTFFQDGNPPFKRPLDAAKDENEQPKKKKLKRPPPTKEQIQAELLRLVQFTDQASAALEETDKTKLKPFSIGLSLGRSVSSSIFQTIKNGDTIDNETAILYRDAMGYLGSIVSDKRADGHIRAKFLDNVISRLDEVLEVADRTARVLAALTDLTLRSTQMKLKKYAEQHWDDMLLSLREYVRSIQRPGRVLKATHVQVPLNSLVTNFWNELRMFMKHQENGMEPRSEERWEMFDEVVKALADWINLWPETSKQPKDITKTFQSMKRFNARFPGRLPQGLLKTVRDRTPAKKRKAVKRAKSS